MFPKVGAAGYDVYDRKGVQDLVAKIVRFFVDTNMLFILHFVLLS